tara:strand:- start:7 stop:441 length:435 start_codon:yes stop_codon:yes gene_type:complete
MFSLSSNTNRIPKWGSIAGLFYYTVHGEYREVLLFYWVIKTSDQESPVVPDSFWPTIGQLCSGSTTTELLPLLTAPSYYQLHLAANTSKSSTAAQNCGETSSFSLLLMYLLLIYCRYQAIIQPSQANVLQLSGLTKRTYHEHYY